MRVVLLGASNLVKALPVVVDTARRALGAGAFDVYAAHGHGRSYGMRSNVLGRVLDGVLDCGLWRALESSSGPARVVLTDIGNDIAYGVGAAKLTDWVEECVRRLTSMTDDVRIVMTLPPVAVLEGISDLQISLARRFFFPFEPLTTIDVRREVPELDRRLRDLAQRHGVAVVEQEAAWYGIDPIHIRRARQPRAWAQILGAWSEPPAALTESRSRPHALRLWTLLPAGTTWLGLPMRYPHTATLAGGVRVSLY